MTRIRWSLLVPLLMAAACGYSFNLEQECARRAAIGESFPSKCNQLNWSESRFLELGDGTVFDLQTRLTWIQNPPAALYVYSDSVAYCENLFFADQSDWRLPKLGELKSILNSASGTGGAYSGGCYWNSLFDGDCKVARYGSCDESTSGTMVVGFMVGQVFDVRASESRHVRCVRP